MDPGSILSWDIVGPWVDYTWRVVVRVLQSTIDVLVYMDVSKNGGTQQTWVFLLKMIILGCFGGTTL